MKVITHFIGNYTDLSANEWEKISHAFKPKSFAKNEIATLIKNLEKSERECMN